MAKVEITPAVVAEISPATYTLHLNEKEFALISVLVGRVSGEPKNEARFIVSTLWESGLKKAYGTPTYSKYSKQIQGSIQVS